MVLPERVRRCRKYSLLIFFYFHSTNFTLIISTITEEAEQSPGAIHKSTTNHSSVQKRSEFQSDKSNESNNEVNKNQNSIRASLSSTNSNLQVPATTTTTKVQIKSNQSSQRTVIKSKRILNTKTEIKENILNKVQEDLNTAKKGASSNTRISPNILENLNLNDHLAYKEYKEAGEYWK